ncbi:MAG: hypothetical protein RR575_00815 [Acinetobacter sp.]
MLLAIFFVIASVVFVLDEMGQIGKILFYAVIVTSGLCLQIFIGFQIAKLAPDNKLINAIIYNSILAFAYVLTINLLFGPMGKAQHQLIALIFCLSLGLLIYLSEHRQECDLSFFHKK